MADRRSQSDEDLVAAAIAGDQDAFATLWRRYERRFTAFIRRGLADAGAVDDAAQDLALQVWRSLPRYDQRSTFPVWAFTIAHRQIIREYERKRRRPEPTDKTAERAVADATAAVDDREELDHALAQLAPDDRTAVVLFHVHGMRHAEIAQILGLSESAVRKRVHRALRAIATYLEAQRDTGQEGEVA